MSELEQIHELADDRLNREERAAVLEAIAASPRLAAEYEAALSMKRVLGTKLSGIRDEETWKLCVKRLDSIDKTRKAESFVGRYAWGLCALFFFMIVGAGTYNRMSAKTLYTGDLTSVMSSTSPVSIDGAGVGTWLSEKLGRRPIDVQSNNLQVVRGAEGRLADGRRVVQLVLRDSTGPLTLIAVSDTTEVIGVKPGGEFCHAKVDAANCVTWVESGHAFILLGQREPQQLETIAQKIRASQ